METLLTPQQVGYLESQDSSSGSCSDSHQRHTDSGTQSSTRCSQYQRPALHSRCTLTSASTQHDPGYSDDHQPSIADTVCDPPGGSGVTK